MPWAEPTPFSRIHTLQADGYGMEAYFWGGGNVTADPDAPQKWAENPNFSSIWDFANDRYRTQYRHNFLFPFGGTFGHSFSLSSWGVDGDVGYTISAAGAGTRLADWTTGGAWFKPDGTIFRTYESLSHPLAAVRAVLAGAAVPENLRIEDGLSVVDLIIDDGVVTLGIEPRTLLPRWVRWTAPHQNLGQVVITTTFAGYQNWDGVQLPFAWSSRIDWRDTLIQTRILDGYYVDSEKTPDIAAPAAVLAQPPPAAAPPAAPITATKVADGLWHLNPGRPHRHRVRGSSRDLRDERHGCTSAGRDCVCQHARAGQAAHAPRRVASPLRPHAGFPYRRRGRAHRHLAPG